MKNKKVFWVITAIFSMFVFAAVSFAANTATINVTSQPIHAKAESDKGGGFTITFDSNTVLAVGDQITADLTLGVTLAKDIDLEISLGGSETAWGAPPATGAPFTDPSGAATVVGAGVYFHVFGTTGTQRITIDVLGATGDSITAGPAAGTDSLILQFLDQQTNTDFGTDGIYIDDDGDGDYDVDATLGDNTLCINVSQFDGDTVNANFDSRLDKFTFVPSNPQIAHVVTALDIAFAPCKGRATGHIEIGTTGGTQSEDTCDYINNESNGWSGNFCGDHYNNRVVIGASSAFDLAEYTVELEILVNGQSGENGVYWTNGSLSVGGYDTQDEACSSYDNDFVDINDWELANGSSADPNEMDSNVNDCSVAAEGRAVVLKSDPTDLGLESGNDYLWIDLPNMNYDLSQISEGDVVSVKVTINKIPCGELFSGTWEIGTFGCPVTGDTYMLLFPYYTAMDGSSGYWNGFALSNLGSTDGTATLTVYEADGDRGTMTVDVAAYSQYVNVLSAMVGDMTQIGGTGTLGDSTCYIWVSTDFSVDGFAMMATPGTGESMGYLPRLLGDRK